MRCLPLLLWLLAGAALAGEAVSGGAREAKSSPQEAGAGNPVLGVWHNQADPSIVLYFQRHKVAWLQNGQLQFGLAKYEKDSVQIWIYGRKKMAWGTDFDQDTLILAAGRKPTPWIRGKDVPKALEIPSVQVAESKPLPAEKIKAVQTMLKERASQLAAASKDPVRAATREKLAKEAAAFLKQIVGEAGWPDAGRFGKETARTAFELIEKCGDVPLIAALLPSLREEAKRGNLSGMDVARLYDRTRLALGERQRYGTQLAKAESGGLLVLPLEDRARVDEFRKELKIGPLNTDKNFSFEDGW